MASSPLGRLGPDAWSDAFDASVLAESLAGRTAPIKALLLDQGPVAGLGNIYADEVLHRAKVHPLTPGRDIPMDRLEAMVTATREVLAEAIEREDHPRRPGLPAARRPGGENLDRLRVRANRGAVCRLAGRRSSGSWCGPGRPTSAPIASTEPHRC